MELRQLESFLQVATRGSFTLAAEGLSLTQPAVTRQIAALEKELGARLLERMGRRTQMTSAGQVLFEYATRMLRLSADAERAVADVSAGISGKLAVGASSTAAAYLLPPILRSFRDAYQNVELSVHTGPSRRIAELVAVNAVDVGVVMDFKPTDGIVAVQLAEYASVAVVHPGHALTAHKEPISPGMLAADPLILMQPGTTLRAYVDDLLLTTGVTEQISIEVDSVEAIKKMIEARLGISILPALSVQSEIAAGALIAVPLVETAGSLRSIAAIHRADKYLSAALNNFVGMLERELRTAPF